MEAVEEKSRDERALHDGSAMFEPLTADDERVYDTLPMVLWREERNKQLREQFERFEGDRIPEQSELHRNLKALCEYEAYEEIIKPHRAHDGPPLGGGKKSWRGGGVALYYVGR